TLARARRSTPPHWSPKSSPACGRCPSFSPMAGKLTARRCSACWASFTGVAPRVALRLPPPTGGKGGAQAETPARGPQAPVLRPGGQGPQPSWPGRGGQQARGLRWAASLCQAVASPATRHDDPDGFHGTLVWNTAGAGRPPAASHSVSVLESSPSPGPRLAD